jgi:hypothetical protein
MSTVLVDTGPLHTLAVPSDQHHTQAQQDAQLLRLRRLAAVITYPVLVEPYQLLARRVPLVAAHGWLPQVTTNASFLNPLDEDYVEAAERVRLCHDQP